MCVTCLKAMHLAFYGLIKWHSTHARYEDRPLVGNFPNIRSEIFVPNSTITVCHSLLYHTCCLNPQGLIGKVAKVMMRVTAYNLPPTVFIVVLETVSKMCYSEKRWWAVSNVCVTLTAHHKHKTSLIFSYIHKVQSNVGTKTAKDSHRKMYKILFQRGQWLHEAQYLSILTVP
jgi:hypothetical protein